VAGIRRWSAWRRIVRPPSRLASAETVWTAAVLGVLLVAIALRFHGLGWDRPSGASAPLHLHPDERHIAIVSSRIDWPGSLSEYFDSARNPANPFNAPDTPSFVYGAVPLYLGKAASTLAGDDPPGRDNSYGSDVVWGRRVTAFADALTVLLVLGAATSLWGRGIGLLASLLYALAVLPTQLAHFWTSDPYVTLFGTSLLWASLAAARAPPRRYLALMAAFAGPSLAMAVASKVSAALLLVLPAGAAFLRRLSRGRPDGLRWGSGRLHPEGSVWSDAAGLLLCLLVAFAVFRVAQPFAFAGPDPWDLRFDSRWVSDVAREMDFQTGKVDYPPFVQFARRTPIVGPTLHVALWGLGLPLGLAAAAGCVAGGWRLFRRGDAAWALPLALVAVTFGFYGTRFVSFMRYFVPAYPGLCMAAAWALAAAWRAAPERVTVFGSLRLPTGSGRAAALSAVVLTAAWALAFQSIYTRENPRVEASRWIYANVPPGSAITMEYWDDALPLPLPGASPSQYRIIPLDLYAPDSPEKVRRLVYGGPGTSGGLIDADYVVLASDRVRGSVPNLEAEYPATIRYYELLESGRLGFELVAEFTSRPSLFGLSIDDSRAEESFTVYDHPRVRIYRKTPAWNAEAAFALLMEARPERAVNLVPAQGRSNGLLLTDREAALQQEGGRFSSVFRDEGPVARWPALFWLLWLELPAIALVPWMVRLLPSMPAAAWGFSKVAGFAAVGCLTWMLVAWGGPTFSDNTAWAAWVAVSAAGLAGWARFRGEMRAVERTHWRSWAAFEALFLGTFGFFLLLRWTNPDLWHHPFGGEKPMELAYFTAVSRSTVLPPYDPWFAGGAMNYYYLGWFLAAVPTRALGLVPEVAFNLAVPTYAALAAAGAGAAGAAVTSAVVRPRDTRWPTASGLLSAGFVVFASNLDPMHQLIERFQAVDRWHAAAGVPVIGGAASLAGGLWAWAFQSASLPPFDWWRSSRVHFGSFDITEFPLWTFTFADLHPHLMAIGFFSGLVALAVAGTASAIRGDRMRPLVLAAVYGFGLGMLRAVHTWDFPTATVTGLAALVTAALCTRRLGLPGAMLAIGAAAATVPWWPFEARFETFGTGVHRASETTPPQQFVAYFGIFLTVATAYLAVRIASARTDAVPLPLAVRPFDAAAMLLLAAGIVALAHRTGYATVALAFLLITLFGLLFWHELRQPVVALPRLLAAGLFGFALAVAAGIDLVTVDNDIQRMNTVFKFSLQAWQLFAIASGAGLCIVAGELFERRGARVRVRVRRGKRLVSSASLAFAACVLFAASGYLWMGVPARQQERFDSSIGPTLDGLAFLRAGVFREDKGTPDPGDDVTLRLADDEPLVRWLRTHPEGTPVIVEAVGSLYHWVGRMSMLTGLPTVIGWDWHQTQQRWDSSAWVAERFAQTRRFWADPDPDYARAFLRKYGVRYVVVGTTERALADPAVLTMLEDMPELHLVFAAGEGRIYEVDQDALARWATARVQAQAE
jgi:YYY domain-containing protein